MTVFRREDVHSRVASWDSCPYRMSRSPILAIVPLIIRRLRGSSPARITIVQRLRWVPLVRHHWRLERGPQKAREFPRDCHRDLGRRLVFCRQFPEAPAQALLRLVGDRNHSPRLSLPAASERDTHVGRCW